MWKTVLLIIVLGVIVLLGWDAWNHRRAIAEVQARAEALVAQQDSLKAEAERHQAEADSVAAVLDSLEAVRAAEKEAAARRAVVLRARADSLAGAIEGLMPPETVAVEVREAVMDAVSDLRLTYEMQITDLTSILAITENSLERSREQIARVNKVNEDLRLAFSALEKERDLWKEAAQPGLWGRIKRDAPGWALSSAISIAGWEIVR